MNVYFGIRESFRLITATLIIVKKLLCGQFKQMLIFYNVEMLNICKEKDMPIKKIMTVNKFLKYGLV